MRIASIEIKDYPPIRQFAIASLSDTVVIGGPNGVGKTKLQEAILQKFRSPTGHPNIRLVVEATSSEEVTSWNGKKALDTAVAPEAQILRNALQRSQKRGQVRRGVLNFDSSRTFEKVEPYAFSWDFPDPMEENVGWEFTFSPFRNRFTDTVHSLHRKLRSQKEEIARRALELQGKGAKEMALDFGDPLERFKIAFRRLLPGKELVALDERTQNIQFTSQSGKQLPITSLSSGEREVVGIVFDFLLRDPADCVVLFDEPEIHLHPELAYRLLHTLREVGDRNQFIFCTHSAEIITASLDHTVVFIAPPSGDGNQALSLEQESEAGQVLHLLGQSLGVVSLGRRIVLIEGERTSLDKQTYGAILGTANSDLVLLPAKGRESLEVFAKAVETVLNRTIWGVDFFVLCDGDASVSTERADRLKVETGGRLRRLPRYHLENYFLSPEILARVFRDLGDSAESWLCDPVAIERKLRDLARPIVSYAAALRVAHAVRLQAGNVDAMPRGCDGRSGEELAALFASRALEELTRLQGALKADVVRAMAAEEHGRLEAALAADGDEWKSLIPGRPVLHAFAASAKLDQTRLKTLYIKAARGVEPDAFAEVKAIFADFSALGKRS